jgi:small subunit ribosomal protein S1
VTSIADFGAFVDVGGVDGLVHISELSWNHVKHPSEVVTVNQEVDVEILDIDYEKQRLSLGLKQTQKDPWLERIKKYSVKGIVKGKVTRIVKFGLFVQIEEDLEGLVHISELSQEPVKRPSDIAKIGDELEVRIIDIDFDKRRMAFSIKQVENPEEAEEEEEKEPKKAKVEVKDKKTKAKKKESGKADKKVEASDKKDKEVKVKEKSTEAEDKESKKKRKIEEILQEMKDEADIG